MILRADIVVFLKVLLSLKIGLTLANQNESELIVEMGKMYETPTAITAFLCWKPNFKKNLIINLGELKNPIAIQFVSTKIKNSIFDHALQNTMFIADLKCAGVRNFLRQAHEANENIFDKPYRWLIIGNGSNESKIPPELFQINVFINSEVIVARNNEQDIFEMDLIYKRYYQDEWLTEHYGTWTLASGFTFPKSEQIRLTTVIRRRNLSRSKIPVVFNIDDKETRLGLENIDSRIRNSRHSVTQWGFEQILSLYDFMNATRYNVFADSWGYYVNGSWTGIFGVLHEKKAELSGTPILLSSSGRLAVARYLINPINTRAMFVFREPPLSYQNNLFLLPFNKAVWCSLAGIVLILMTTIYANAQWEWRKSGIVSAGENVEVTPNDKLTLSDVAMMIVGAITQQGSFIELRGAMGRLMMFTLFLAFLFLFTAYSACIVVLLQSTSKQIKTLSDLLNSKLEMGVENTSYNVYYFTKATEPVRKAIYQTKIAPRGSKPRFMSTEEGVKRMQKEPFAFNMDLAGYKLVAKYFYEHEKCGLQEIAYIPGTPPWLNCRKGSPYEELIKIGYYRINEHGLCDRANKVVYMKKPVCTVSGGSFISVSIVDVYPPLLMLLYGMLLAISLLVLEIFVHRRLLKKIKENNTDSPSYMNASRVDEVAWGQSQGNIRL